MRTAEDRERDRRPQAATVPYHNAQPHKRTSVVQLTRAVQIGSCEEDEKVTTNADIRRKGLLLTHVPTGRNTLDALQLS